jgi:AraC-like DNA-binding protein
MIRLIRLPVPPTRATTHTLIYLTEGEAIMAIGSENYKIVQDECLVVPAGQVFSFENLDINKGFLCNFHDDSIVGKFGKNELLKDFEFLNIWGNPRICLDVNTSEHLNFLLERIYLEYSTNGLHHLALIQSYFIASLCELNQIYQPLSKSAQKTSIAITNQFKALVSAHVRQKHKVSDYAAMLNISPNHLNRVVKQISGKSPTVWIEESLILEAKVLLYQTSYSISQITEAIGMSDQSYFSRLFKKSQGVTPLEFRKMVEKS